MQLYLNQAFIALKRSRGSGFIASRQRRATFCGELPLIHVQIFRCDIGSASGSERRMRPSLDIC